MSRPNTGIVIQIDKKAYLSSQLNGRPVFLKTRTCNIKYYFTLKLGKVGVKNCNITQHERNTGYHQFASYLTNIKKYIILIHFRCNTHFHWL